MKRSRAKAAARAIPPMVAIHAKSHGRRDRESGCDQSPRERVAHDKGSERARDHARHEGKCSPVAFVHVVIVPGRAPEQESTDHCDHRTACELELRRAAALSEGAADHGKAGEDQDKRKSDMGQGKNGAVGDAFPQFARLTEMVGHEHRFAVPRHHRMHRAEQDGSRHGSEDSAHVSVGDVAETARHAAIEPTLDSDKAIHPSYECLAYTTPELWSWGRKEHVC